MRGLAVRNLFFVTIGLALGFVSACATVSNSPSFEDRRIAEFSDDAPKFDLAPYLKECFSTELGFPVKKNLHVNGKILGSIESKQIQWISHCVVPYLPGTTSEQAEIAARATWWSLREGVIGNPKVSPFRYATCHDDKRTKKHPHGQDFMRSTVPFADCPTNIWQVGLAAGQAMNYPQKVITPVIEQLRARISPDLDEASLLQWTANLAEYPVDSEENRGIIKTTDRVRLAWLVRNPLIAFPLVADLEVRRECLIDHKPSCTFGDYPAAVDFAHTRSAIAKSIADLKHIYLNRLAE